MGLAGPYWQCCKNVTLAFTPISEALGKTTMARRLEMTEALGKSLVFLSCHGL